MERERKPPQEGMEENRQDGSSRSWFKVTFPSGVKYDEKCLQNLIQSLCSVPFNLIESQCQKMHTKIFVKSASIAFELKKVSSAICNEDNERVTKIRGYEVPQQPLDHQRLISDPDMTDSSNSRADVMTHDSEMGPNLRNCMAASLQIHEENKPKLLSFNSSNNTPYQLVGLPDTMQKAPNIRSLNLSKNEDNHEVPPPIVFGIEASKKLPVCRGSIFGSETLKNLILKFLQQYYWIYDYGDRLGLLDAYHDEACFSMTTPFNPEDLVSSCLDKYSKGSRNIKKLKDPVLQVQLLKHTKRDVVDCLSVLPRTQHDVSSFVVDMCVQTEKMLCFSVSGAFKEGECL
ncbi:nuclear RNA export factor 3-like [Loxodonta africana]|uniref:nuclear RNA export factor 3-like n=1 Tax=Loxodonta africana TaxID=9785 RepID=UPI000C810B6E|nr:nuclear RNA export factor 3-like [Loxodonta africana]